MIAQRVMEQAQQHIQKIALIVSDRTYTYGNLYSDVSDLSECIRKLPMEKNEAIGIMFPNRYEFIVLLLAAAQNGIPVSLIGANNNTRELDFYINQIGLRYILAAPEMDTVVMQAGGRALRAFSGFIHVWCFYHEKITNDFLDGDFICQFSSGTNGMPKAAVRTHQAVWHEIEKTAEIFSLTENDVFFTIPPIHHSYGLIAGVLMPLCFGLSLILMERFLPSDAILMIQKYKPTFMLAVPFMYNMFNNCISGGVADFSTLKYSLYAGAPMPVDVANDFSRKFGCKIVSDYGSTETGVICINLDYLNHLDSVGFAATGTVSVVSEEGSVIPDVNVKGEIAVESPANARAYIYPKELNDTAFQNNKFMTADIGSIDEKGYVRITGRKGGMINVAGVKVDPVEIESILMQMEEIEEAAVVGINVHAAGEYVKAFIVANTAITTERIISHCKKNLSAHKIPKVLEFVEKLPRSQTGKVLKKYFTHYEYSRDQNSK